jgi:hypothetical protein
MVNEDFYTKMASQITDAKAKLKAAQDLMAFAEETKMPITTDKAAIDQLQTRINDMELALTRRGYSVV